MANSVEQEIRVKVKAVLEGFEALKQVRNELRGVASEKVTVGQKGEIKALAGEVRNYNKELENGVSINRGFFGTLAQIIGVAGKVGDFLSGIVTAFQFLGITGTQVISALRGGFTQIGSAATGAFNTARGAVTQMFSSITSAGGSGGGGGLITNLSSAFTSLGGSATRAVPALASGAAAIGAVGAAAIAALAAVAAIVAALAAIAAVVGSVALIGTVGSAAFLSLNSSAFEYLDKLEQIEIGTGALIAQLGQIKRDGIALTGMDAVNAGISLAKEELAKLRIDAIQTSATYEQLAEAFQAAVGSGLSAGLSLGEIRQITVGLSQAGAALGVPYNQLRQEINSILEGTIDINSRIAKNLGITNEEVKLWKQKGTLAEELNKRLAGFTAAGVKAATTLTGLKSNLQEAVNVLTGEAALNSFEKLKDRLSKILNSVFDFKTGGIDKALKPIAQLIDKFMVQGIERFADAIEYAIGLAKQLGRFIQKNSDVIDDILGLIDAITRNVIGMIAQFFGVSTETANWRGILEGVRSVLQFINGILIAYGQYVRFAANFWQMTVSAIQNGVIPAVDALISRIPLVAQLAQLMAHVANVGASNAGNGTVRGQIGAELGGGNLTIGGPRRVGGGGKRGGGGGANSRNQLLDAQDDLERTRLQNAVSEYLALIKTKEGEIEDLYQNRKLATEEYFRLRGNAAKFTLDAELIKERGLLELAEKKLARSKEAAERVRAQGEVEQIESRIKVLETEQAEKLKENERERLAAVEALGKEYAELRNILNEFEGLGIEANTARLNEKYKEILERATVDGRQDIVELINSIKKYETALIKLEDSEKGYNEILAQRDDAIDQINEQVERGAITEEQAASRRIELERQYKGELLDVLDGMIAVAEAAKQFDRVTALRAARRTVANSGELTNPQKLALEQAQFDRLRSAIALAENAVNNQVTSGAITSELGDVKRLEIQRQLKPALEASIAKMRELAAATASLDDDIAVENLALEIQNLGVQTDTLGKGIIEALRGGLGGFLNDLQAGTQSVLASFQGMVASILQSIARLAANELLRSLFSSGIFKSGGPLGFLSGLKFADGGAITGAGTGVSDSVPIMASAGEYMIKASTVRKLGVGFLNQLNSGNFRGLFGRFAAGGAIGAGGSNGGAAESAGNGVRIFNVIDPNLVKEYLATSAGESAILNVIKKNPQYVKQLLV